MDFVVNRQGRQIAEIHKRWISWGDTYEVTVYEEDLEDLITLSRHCHRSRKSR